MRAFRIIINLIPISNAPGGAYLYNRPGTLDGIDFHENTDWLVDEAANRGSIDPLACAEVLHFTRFLRIYQMSTTKLRLCWLFGGRSYI